MTNNRTTLRHVLSVLLLFATVSLLLDDGGQFPSLAYAFPTPHTVRPRYPLSWRRQQPLASQCRLRRRRSVTVKGYSMKNTMTMVGQPSATSFERRVVGTSSSSLTRRGCLVSFFTAGTVVLYPLSAAAAAVTQPQQQQQTQQATPVTPVTTASTTKTSNPSSTAGTTITPPSTSTTTSSSPQQQQQQQQPTTTTSPAPSTVKPQPKTELQPVNLTKVVTENTINVTMTCTDETLLTKSCVKIDRSTYTKVKVRDVPDWVLPIFRPRPEVIKEIPNNELLVSAIVAGAVTEMVRTGLLYPLSTVKARIQMDARSSNATMPKTLRDKVQSLSQSFAYRVKEGNLYAGLVPSLLVSVPASGVYCGIRDVTKRILVMTITTPTPYDDVAVSLVGALVADVVSLMVRTPADALAVRRQIGRSTGPRRRSVVTNETTTAATAAAAAAAGDGRKGTKEEEKEEEDEGEGRWFQESLERIPALIVTDLPYLLSRIALNRILASGQEGIGRYELLTIPIACICAALTTPFDVARTRILIERDTDSAYMSDGRAGGREGVWQTMVKVMEEGEGGVRNLFAGWLERTIYLGVGRAWLDPIRVIGYLGIRDAVLLEWFD